jgi:2-polyprenyl-3-methyl-5-hydroxy-6-metoxy-1,4-benzoquinol methylase
MNYYETFDPAILLGDRLGLTLYGMFVEAYLSGSYEAEATLYSKFIRYFRKERAVHNPANFAALIDSIRANGMHPASPVAANPAEYALMDGAHRCATAIQLGISKVPYILRFTDDRADDSVFKKIFSATELEAIYRKREDYIARCAPDVALRCRVRSIVRNSQKSFQAPFSSMTKIPALRTYQALESLGLSGKRPSEKRMEIYEMRRHLKPEMQGLEIGCNVGFFSLSLAKYVKSMVGFDRDENYIKVANLVQKSCGIGNCSFFASPLKDFRSEDTFDLIISTAVHGWADMSFPNYVSFVDRYLRPGGVMLFESHELDAEKDWAEKKCHLQSKYTLVDSGIIDDTDKSIYASEIREFLILQKQ